MKDTIYIDVEDDITSIITKVKGAGSKIVALVPPKRVGALHSVVNLKLLLRASQEVSKQVVLITSNHGLITHAAGLRIPVARNLQSRPEIPRMDEPKFENDEVIDGGRSSSGGVGTHIPLNNDNNKPSEQNKADKISEKVEFMPDEITPPSEASAAAPAKSLKDKIKIPNFDSFRKRIFLLGGLGALLIVFLIWAIFFAPKATITLNASTTAVNINKQLRLATNLSSSAPDKLDLKPNVQEVKKSSSVEFDATGKKEVGEKATGTVTIKNAESSEAITVDSGTTLTSESGHKFKTTAAVTVPGASVSGGNIVPGSEEVGVQANAIGPEYNLAPQSYTVSGHSGLSGSGAQMSGGTKKEVNVVSQKDVDRAKDDAESADIEAIKEELKSKFDEEFIVIEESFIASDPKQSVSPAVGEEAQKAKVTFETTYMLIGLARKDVEAIIKSEMDAVLDGKTDQQQYSNGADKIRFQEFQKENNREYSVRMITTGAIGPKVDLDQLAERLAGKRTGEIQAIVSEIPGMENADIKFSPFWVNSAPKASKIEIKLSVANE